MLKLVAVLMTVLMPGWVGAEPSAPFDVAVRLCVQRTSPERGRQFDAYITPDKRSLRTIGTTQQRFTFRRCLAEMGHDLPLTRDAGGG